MKALILGAAILLAACQSSPAAPATPVAVAPPAAATPTAAPTHPPLGSANPTAAPTGCYVSGVPYPCGGTPYPVAATPTPPATPKPLPRKVLLSRTSSGSHILTFTIPGAYGLPEIDMSYAYRCSGSGNFIIESTNSVYPDPFYVNQLDIHGSGVLVDVNETATQLSVQVISECSWTIKVTAIPTAP